MKKHVQAMELLLSLIPQINTAGGTPEPFDQEGNAF